MLRKLNLLFYLLLFTIDAYAQLSSGMIAHWSLNGNANDVTGNGHNGTIYNVTPTTGQNGLPNTAMLFNGTSSYIDIPYLPDLNVGNFSICAVVQPLGFYQGLCQGNFIIERGTYGAPGGYNMHFHDNMYNSCYTLDTNLHNFILVVGTINPAPTAWQYPVHVHTGNWYCVVETYNGSSFKVYINGTLAVTIPVSGTPGTSTDGLRIGKYQAGGTGYPYWFNGAIDDLRLYNRALSDTEAANYCGLQPPDTMVQISQPISKTAFCPLDTFHLKYSVTLSFTPGNIFTAQLSDPFGSFASPVAIGSVTSTGSGTIICTIPAGSITGNAYRVRIVASNPTRTSLDNGTNLTINPIPVVTATPKSATICAGETVTLLATGAQSYSWSPATGLSTTTSASVIAKPLVSTKYIVTGTSNNCTGADTIDINVFPSPLVNITPATDTLCVGESTNLQASGANTYAWSPAAGLDATSGSSVNATPALTTAYVVWGIDENGCKGSDTAFVYVGQPVFLSTRIDLCDDTAFIFNGSNITDSGSYVYKGKTVLGCDSTFTLTIAYLRRPQANFDNSPMIANTPTTFTNTSSGAIRYFWNFGDNTSSSEASPVHMFTRTGVYATCLIAENIDGCKDTACHNVSAEISKSIGVPSAFSPNGDGINDILYVRGTAVSEIYLRIYNRWGQMIFETRDMNVGWDGKFRGKEQGVDVVAYTLHVVFIDGTSQDSSGNITIIK